MARWRALKINDEWKDAEKEKPRSERLYCLLLLQDHRGVTRPGWWTGTSWDGSKIEELKDVKLWKFNKNFIPI